MTENNILAYINKLHKEGGNLNDDLWKQGKVFLLKNENNEICRAEAYGSYIDNNAEYNPVNKNVASKLYEQDENFDEFDGHRIKEFFMVDSSAATEFMDEIKNNPNCSYISKFNDLIKSGYVPKKVPALVMQDDCGWENNDAFASRFLNLFGVPTVYNFNLMNEYKISNFDMRSQVLCSLDFVGDNETFIVLRDYLKEAEGDAFYRRGYDNRLESLIEDYKKVYLLHFDKAEKTPQNPYSTPIDMVKELKKMEEELCYLKLCRVYGAGDGDFGLCNCGVIIDNKTNKIKIAPCFDLEDVGFFNKFISQTLKGVILDVKLNSGGIDEEGSNKIYEYIKKSSQYKDDATTQQATMLKDIKFIAQKHPQVLENFISRVDEVLSVKEDKECELDGYLKTFYKYDAEDFKENLTCVRDICGVVLDHEMKNNMEME